MSTTVAVPHLIRRVHADVDPGQYWLCIDEWLLSLGAPDNAAWSEVAPLYEARIPPSRAAFFVIEGRRVTP